MAILFSRANFLSRKIPPAPESTRAFISNFLSTFFPSPVTSREIENDFSLLSASSTGDKEFHGEWWLTSKQATSLKT